jgi:hypothetical protein
MRFGIVTPARGRNLYGRNLIRAFENQYGFIGTTKAIAEFDLGDARNDGLIGEFAWILSNRDV